MTSKQNLIEDINRLFKSEPKKHTLDFIIEERSNNYTEFEFKKWKDQAFEDKAFVNSSLYPEDQQEKMFKTLTGYIDQKESEHPKINYLEEIAPLIRKYWNRMSKDNQDYIIDTWVADINDNLGSYHCRNLAIGLFELGDCIPQSKIQAFVEGWVNAYMQTNLTKQQDDILEFCLIPFANMIPGSLINQLLEQLLKNVDVLNARHNCLSLLAKMGPSLTPPQRHDLIQKILDMESKTDLAYTRDMYNAIIKLCTFHSDSSLKQTVQNRLIERCCSEHTKVQENASDALIEFSKDLDNAESIALINLLEKKLKDEKGDIRPAVVKAMSEIIYQKEYTNLLQEKLKNSTSITKLILGKI